jgi:hypothetical protein
MQVAERFTQVALSNGTGSERSGAPSVARSLAGRIRTTGAPQSGVKEELAALA